MRESSSLFLHAFLPRQPPSSSPRQSSCIATESNSTPVKLMVVAGPSAFLGWSGRLVSLHVSCVMAWLLLHCGESGGPTVTKSSM
jgi:hypothetical protein